MAALAGGIDIALNAVGIVHVQGTPFADLSLDDFAAPSAAYTRTVFVTAKAVSRHMAKSGTGVFLIMSTPGSRLPGTGYLGYGAACAAKEGMSRLLAAELAPSGIRVICLQPHAIPQAAANGSHSAEVFRPVAAARRRHGGRDARRRGERHASEAPAHAVAGGGGRSIHGVDRAGAMTGTIANMTCGALVD